MSQALLFIRNYLYNPVETGWSGFWSGVGYLIIQLVFAIVLAISHAIAIVRSVYKQVDRVWLFLEKSLTGSDRK